MNAYLCTSLLPVLELSDNGLNGVGDLDTLRAPETVGAEPSGAATAEGDMCRLHGDRWSEVNLKGPQIVPLAIGLLCNNTAQIP